VTNGFDYSVLRVLRQRLGLTQQEVSRRSGVSAAVISKLERNQSQGEVSTIARLARVYGMSAADLLGLAENISGERAVARRYDSGGFTFDVVRFAGVECYHGRAAAGGRVSRPEIHGNDVEICWVLRGGVTIALAGEEHVLKAGEALRFDAVLEHTYAAAEDSEIVVMHLQKKGRKSE
jgi:transcriptional regulator with XRE-family HTH domain